MAIEVVVPMLGITVEKGKILRWLKKEGDPVQKGEPLFEVETEKVVTEVESPGTGILKKIIVPENLEVPVLTLVAVITKPDEELPAQYEAFPTLPAVGTKPAEPPPQAVRLSPSVTPVKSMPVPRNLLIVGAGPGGYVAAIRAAQLGIQVTLVEKGKLGGTCLNWGCIPTKSFLADVKLLRKIKSSEVFANTETLAINWPKLTARKNQVVETLRNGVAAHLKSQKVNLLRGRGKFIEPHAVEVDCEGKKEIIRAEAVIVATGSRPSPLPQIPFDGQRILSSDDIFLLPEPPMELVIIGGGVIGVEFAMIFNSLGTKVTILEMLPQIIATEEPEVIQGLHRLLEKGGIRILTQAKVLSASPLKEGVSIVLQRKNKEEELSAEKVLMAVGRKPNTEDLGLDKVGIRLNGSFIEVNSRMETAVPGIYAIGDVTGKMMLAHAASAQGIVAVENMAGKDREIDYQRIPNCIYTLPEVASVGLKEEEARQEGYELQVGRFPYRNSGKALAMGEPEGFVKIIAEKELGQVLGVHILGDRATDLIGECVLAMNLEGTIEEWGETVKGHPTLSEILNEAALDAQGWAIHSPKK
ncbi:MAG: dihydrolipoamide dehydrogenase [Deltaproteobacteria bacterium]|nr:dihydrolipoamide dehydrogenase [Deltaproteobacteria bacterium]